jgi:hypothetical protein
MVSRDEGFGIRQGKGIFRLGKAEVSGSTPDVGSSESQVLQRFARLFILGLGSEKYKPLPDRCHFYFFLSPFSSSSLVGGNRT